MGGTEKSNQSNTIRSGYQSGYDTNTVAIDKEALANKIRTLEGLTADDRAALLGLLRQQKRYGLVWEDKPEDVEERMLEELPVLTEVKDRYIKGASEDSPNHILIEGDNLHALTALTYTHAGKIDVIYIDPPYNTGNKDFVYNDAYVDKEDEYRHSKWLSFMSKRLRIAKQLLSDHGVIFISIDDNEQAQLKLLCDEIFGGDKNEATISYVRKTSGKQDSANFVKSTEYILVYRVSEPWEAASLVATDKVTDRYNKLDLYGRKYRETDLRKTGNADRRIDRPFMFYPFYYNPQSQSLQVRETKDEKLIQDGFIEIFPIKPDNTDGRWRWAYATASEKLELLVAKEMPKYKGKYTIYEKDYIDKKEDIRTVKEHTSWDRKEFNSDNAIADFKALGFGNQDFPFPKSVDLIKHIFFIANNRKGLYLDFFAGSGTTLHALMVLNEEDGGNRQCILVTNNENGICENVTYERNKRVIHGYSTPKGTYVDGLRNNSLRYYRTDFVPRQATMANMRQLMQAATDLLCIKEDLYDEHDTFLGKKWKKDVLRYFAKGDKSMVIVYKEKAIEYIVPILEKEKLKSPIKVYVFSPSRDPYSEMWDTVREKVILCALPAAIYDAYKRVLKKPRKKYIDGTKNESTDTIENKSPQEQSLFDNLDEEGGEA